MSVFVEDRRLHKICLSTKYTVEKSLEFLGIYPEQIIKGSGFFVWDILLLSREECMAVVDRELITKGLILRTKYRGRRRTRVTIFEVPLHIKGVSSPVSLTVWENSGSLLRLKVWCMEVRYYAELHPLSQLSGCWGPY